MKIPVIATIGAAFKFFWQGREQFYYLALPAVILLSILYSFGGPPTSFELNLPGVHIEHSSKSTNAFAGNSVWAPLAGLLGFIFLLIAFPLYSVAWHRSYLRPNEAITIRECYRWRARHWIFLWATLKVVLFLLPVLTLGGLLLTLMATMLPFLSVVLMPLLVILGVVGYCRLSLWLPASAVDVQMDLSKVLALTKGNSWRIMAILVFTGLITALLDGAANSMIAAASHSLGAIGVLTAKLLANFAVFLIMYAGMAVGITALSMIFQMLVEHVPTEKT